MVQPDQATGVVQAGRVLARHGLVTAFGHVSARSDRQLIITPAADLAEVTAADLIVIDLNAATLPPGAPAEAWAHLRVYAARPHVSAASAPLATPKPRRGSLTRVYGG